MKMVDLMSEVFTPDVRMRRVKVRGVKGDRVQVTAHTLEGQSWIDATFKGQRPEDYAFGGLLVRPGDVWGPRATLYDLALDAGLTVETFDDDGQGTLARVTGTQGGE